MDQYTWTASIEQGIRPESSMFLSNRMRKIEVELERTNKDNKRERVRLEYIELNLKLVFARNINFIPNNRSTSNYHCNLLIPKTSVNIIVGRYYDSIHNQAVDQFIKVPTILDGTSSIARKYVTRTLRNNVVIELQKNFKPVDINAQFKFYMEGKLCSYKCAHTQTCKWILIAICKDATIYDV